MKAQIPAGAVPASCAPFRPRGPCLGGGVPALCWQAASETAKCSPSASRLASSLLAIFGPVYCTTSMLDSANAASQ